MPKRNAAYMADRRDDILNAAINCLKKAGLEKFTIDAVCQEAGISTGALYRHFATKRDILLALLDLSSKLRESTKFETLPELESSLIAEVAQYDAPGAAIAPRANFQLLQLSFADPEMFVGAKPTVTGLEDFFNQSFRRIAANGGLSSSVDLDLAARRLASLLRGIWLAKAVDPELSASAYIDCVRSEFDRLRQDAPMASGD